MNKRLVIIHETFLLIKKLSMFEGKNNPVTSNTDNSTLFAAFVEFEITKVTCLFHFRTNLIYF